MKSLFTFISVFACLCLSIFTANAAVPIEAYGQLPTVGDVVLSPSGERVAYRYTKSDDADAIVIFSLKEEKIISSLRVDQIDPNSMVFADDDHLLLVVTQHVKWQTFKHHFDAGTIYTFNVETTKVEPLIKLGERLTGRNFIYPGQQIWNIVGFSPERKQVYVGAWVADSVDDYNPDYGLVKVNIDGKRKPKIVQRHRTAIDYFVNSKGEVVGIETLEEGNNKHGIVSLTSGRKKSVYEYEAELRTHSFEGLNAAGDSIIFFRNDDNAPLYYSLSLQDGSIREMPEHEIMDSLRDSIVDDSKKMLGSEYTGLFPSYDFFNSQLDEKMKNISGLFPSHSVHLVDWTESWNDIVVRVEGSQHAGNYILFSKDSQPKLIAQSRPAITTPDIQPIGHITFRARDGLEIPTIITLPRSHAEQPANLPLVILPHGGPASHDQIGFDYQAQALASRGYLVAQPQFRGSTGYGKELYDAGMGEWGRKMQDDLTDAVQFLVKKGYADPDRVCIAGSSYGGYAALAGAAFTPKLYACVVSFAGVSNLQKMIIDDRSRYGRDSDAMPYFTKSILNGDYNKEALKERSPYFFADKIEAPVLLIHGAEDTVVEFEQSFDMKKALEKAGKSVTLAKLKNEDHYLRDGSTRLEHLRLLLEFVDQHIGNK